MNVDTKAMMENASDLWTVSDEAKIGTLVARRDSRKPLLSRPILPSPTSS